MIRLPAARNQRVQPALPDGRRWRWFAGAFFVVGSVLAIAAGISWLLDPRHLPIREVRIAGEFRHLSPTHLQQVVAMEASGGFFSINVGRIRAAVLADPWVREVSVQRLWPDSLLVTVYEQVAVAMWGGEALLSEEGRLFYPPPASYPPALLRLNGPSGTEAAVLDRYHQLQALCKPLGIAVASVELNRRRAWTFELQGGMRVVVGRGAFEPRVKRLLAVLPGAAGEALRNAAAIDLRYTNGFAIQPHQRAELTRAGNG